MNKKVNGKRLAVTKKSLVALLLCVCLLLPCAGCKMRESEIEYVIGVSLANLSEQWRLVLKEELEQEAKKHDNVNLIFTDAANDSEKQASDVERLMNYGIDLLIISPGDVAKMTPLVSRVYEEIPVIVLDRAVEGFDYTLFIGPDNELIGKQASAEIKEMIGNDEDGMVLELMTNTYASHKRSDTFTKVIRDAGIDTRQMLLTEPTRDCAQDTLLGNTVMLDGVDIIFAHNDYVAYGARLALDAIGNTDIKIVGLDGFEGDQSGLQMVKEGIIDATIHCPTGGKEAINYAFDILDEAKGVPKQIILRSGSVDKENVEDYLSDEIRVYDDRRLWIGCIQAGDEGGWREANQKSIISAAKEFDIELSLIVTEQSLEEQIREIRNCIEKGMDAIVLTPVVENGWEEVLAEAKAAGIPVFLSDRKMNVSEELYTAYIGGDFVEQGKKCASWVLQNMDNLESIDILEIQGTKDASPTVERKEGFERKILGASNCQIVYSDFGDYNREGGKKVVQEYLDGHEWDIEVIYAHNDDMALGAIEVLEENGIKPGKDVKIISIDGTADALDALQKGEMNCVAECNPLLGPQLMKAISDYLIRGDELPLRIITDEMVFTANTPKEFMRNRTY